MQYGLIWRIIIVETHIRKNSYKQCKSEIWTVVSQCYSSFEIKNMSNDEQISNNGFITE